MQLLTYSLLVLSVLAQIQDIDYISDLPVDPYIIEQANEAINNMVNLLNINYKCGDLGVVVPMVSTETLILPNGNKIVPYQRINQRLYSIVTTVKADLEIIKSQIIQYNNVVFGDNNTVTGDDNVVIGSSNSVLGSNQWIFTSNFISTAESYQILVVGNYLVKMTKLDMILFNQVGEVISCLTEEERNNYFHAEWTRATKSRRVLI